jgi:hypothetical protein
MNHYRFDDSERSYQARARSQPPIFKRERSAERFRPYERTYSRDEKRRIENEMFDYYSEPEILSSYNDDDDDDDNFSGSEPDWEIYDERRPVRLNRIILT